MGYSLRSKRFRASSARKVGRGRKKKKGMTPSIFFNPALTFAQLLDWKRLLRRLHCMRCGYILFLGLNFIFLNFKSNYYTLS